MQIIQRRNQVNYFLFVLCMGEFYAFKSPLATTHPPHGNPGSPWQLNSGNMDRNLRSIAVTLKCKSHNIYWLSNLNQCLIQIQFRIWFSLSSFKSHSLL